jgi:hypothetical protein
MIFFLRPALAPRSSLSVRSRYIVTQILLLAVGLKKCVLLELLVLLVLRVRLDMRIGSVSHMKHHNPCQTFFVDSFMRRSGWDRSMIFAHVGEIAATPIRLVRFPTPPLRLALVLFN